MGNPYIKHIKDGNLLFMDRTLKKLIKNLVCFLDIHGFSASANYRHLPMNITYKSLLRSYIYILSLVI